MDPYIQELKGQIERVKRRSADFLCKDYIQTSSVTSVLKSLQWDTLECRSKVGRLCMLYRIHHDQTAIPAEKFLHPVTRHSRSLHNLAINQPHLTKTATSTVFFPQRACDWNKLPLITANISTTSNKKHSNSYAPRKTNLIATSCIKPTCPVASCLVLKIALRIMFQIQSMLKKIKDSVPTPRQLCQI